MTAAIVVSPGDYTSNTNSHSRPGASTAIPSTPRRTFEVPGGQVYYWSQVWQENERRAEEEIAAGKAVRFDNAADALRWLRSDED